MEKFAVRDKVKFRFNAFDAQAPGGIAARLFSLGVPAFGVFRVLRVDEQVDRVLLSAIRCNADPFWESAENLESLGSIVKIGQVRKQLQELGYSEKEISRISSVILDV